MAGQVGTVHTFTVMYRLFGPAERHGGPPDKRATSASGTPYAVGWIDLPDGTRDFGEVTGEPRIGMPVEQADDGTWRPIE